MRPSEFLRALQPRLEESEYMAEQLAASGLSADLNLAAQPRLLGRHGGRFVKFDFVIEQELKMEVNVPPPHHLLIAPETMVTRLLDRVGLSPEVKTGDAEFDARYLVKNAPAERVHATVTPEFRSTLRALEPFLEFQMTHKEYRLLKEVDLRKYTPDDAMADLDRLLRLVDLAAGSPG